MKKFAFALLVLSACSGEWQGSAEHAEQEARTHAEKLGWELKGVACTGSDSDADGYISCTVALTDGSERALECASGGWDHIKGCKSADLLGKASKPHSGPAEADEEF